MSVYFRLNETIQQSVYLTHIAEELESFQGYKEAQKLKFQKVMGELQKSRKRFKETREVHQNKIKELEFAYAQLEEAYGARNSVIENQSARIAEQEVNASEQEVAIRQLQATVESMEFKNQTETARIVEHERNTAEMKQIIEDLRTSIGSLEIQHQTKMRACKTDAEQTGALLSEYATEIKNYQAIIQDYQQNQAEQENEMNVLRNDIQTQQNLHETQQSQSFRDIQRAKSVILEKERQIRSQNQKLSEYEIVVKELEDTYERRKAKFNQNANEYKAAIEKHSTEAHKANMEAERYRIILNKISKQVGCQSQQQISEMIQDTFMESESIKVELEQCRELLDTSKSCVKKLSIAVGIMLGLWFCFMVSVVNPSAINQFLDETSASNAMFGGVSVELLLIYGVIMALIIPMLV